jgi:hypothetical protein
MASSRERRKRGKEERGRGGCSECGLERGRAAGGAPGLDHWSSCSAAVLFACYVLFVREEESSRKEKRRKRRKEKEGKEKKSEKIWKFLGRKIKTIYKVEKIFLYKKEINLIIIK